MSNFTKTVRQEQTPRTGIKIFAHTGSSGMVYDFEVYVGKGIVKNVSSLGISGDIVLCLVDGLSKGQNYSVHGHLVHIFQLHVCPLRNWNFDIGNFKTSFLQPENI